MISADIRDGLNVALNESNFLALAVDRAARTAVLQLEVLTIGETGSEPADRVVGLVLAGVTRVAASHRAGRWDDVEAAIMPLPLDELDATIRGFGGLPIYGWEFIDPPEKSWAHWRDRLSLDEVISEPQAPHVIDLFQEGSAVDRHLDVRVWFDDLHVVNRQSRPIALQDFIEGGVRWWDALHAGDSRAGGHGIYPLQPGDTAKDIIAKLPERRSPRRWLAALRRPDRRRR